MARYGLGVDIGSGSIKLTLLGADGTVAASLGEEYPTLYPRAGWAEQEPEDWCRAFAKALPKLLCAAGAKPSEIAAIAPDAATHTAVLLDGGMRPVRPAIHWTDQRSGAQVARLKAECLPEILEKTLHAPTTVWTLPQMMWLHDNEPEALARTEKLLFAKDYLRHRLTGDFATDRIDAMGAMFYDCVRERWDESLCERAHVPPEWLPPLRDPSDVAGRVTAEAAREFGLAEGTPVLVGTTDTVLEQLAAGSVAAGHGVVKLATAGRICVISDRAHPNPFLFNYRHVVPGLWYPGTGTKSCAVSYRWYRDALGGAPYPVLNEGAETVPPGCEGLLYHPYLQGELTPYNDPDLCGSFTGIRTLHGRNHFTRAVLEGVAFSLRDCVTVLADEGLHMTRARIIGGGATSALWRGIVADTLNLTLEKAAVDDSSFGAAMLACVGAGMFPDYVAAAETCVRVQSVTRPDAERHAIYEACYARYKAVHDALAPVYRAK